MHPDKPTILLVEDNPDDEALTRRAFAKARIANHVVVARDGAEALVLLHGGAPLAPHLILLDLKLPKVDGLEVLAAIRRVPATATLPVVILTSSREEQDVVEGYRLGCNAYVQKPVDMLQFQAAVETLGLFFLVLNVVPHREGS